MPQLTLEFSSNIIEKNDFESLFLKCHKILTESLPTELSHCKSRAIECQKYCIGDGNQNNAFVHATLKVLSGRSQIAQEIVAKAILETLKNNFKKSLQELKLQITLEVQELSNIYLKITS